MRPRASGRRDTWRIQAGLGRSFEWICCALTRSVGADENSVSDAEPRGAESIQDQGSVGERYGRARLSAISAPTAWWRSPSPRIPSMPSRVARSATGRQSSTDITVIARRRSSLVCHWNPCCTAWTTTCRASAARSSTQAWTLPTPMVSVPALNASHRTSLGVGSMGRLRCRSTTSSERANPISTFTLCSKVRSPPTTSKKPSDLSTAPARLNSQAGTRRSVST